ncbi:MAG: glycosyltransferase, partial [Acidimicrobiia bacterium]
LRYGVAALTGTRRRPALVYLSIGEPLYWIRSGRQRLIQRLLLSRVDLVLAVSERTASQLVGELGVPADRVRVAHTGVPEHFLDVVPEPPDGTLRLLFLGNLSTEKNPRAALEVVRRLTGSGRPTRLRYVGAGPLRQSIEREVLAGLAEVVELCGSVEDVRPHLAWADVLILPSLTEGLPGAVLEAAAAGVPTVAFDVGGTGEAVIDGVTGRLVPPGDLDAFVAAVSGFSDEAARQRAGEAARELVRRKFTLSRSVGSHSEILVDLLGGR